MFLQICLQILVYLLIDETDQCLLRDCLMMAAKNHSIALRALNFLTASREEMRRNGSTLVKFEVFGIKP
jgi:hypothetical protein